MKLYALPVLASVLLLTTCLQAQENTSTETSKDKKAIIKSSYPKNIIKVNGSSLLMNNYSFSYERVVARKISVVGGYRFMPSSKVGGLTLVEKVIDQIGEEDDDVIKDLNKISASNNAFTAEVRFYTGKHPGARGFYVSLYGRYATFKVDYPYEYTENGTIYNVPMKADTKLIGGGVMIGAQWLIAKRVAIDFYIIGGHYGNISGNASAVTDLSDLTPSEKADMKETLDDLIKIGDKRYINSTVTDNGVTAKISGPGAGIRAAGLSIGIAF